MNQKSVMAQRLSNQSRWWIATGMCVLLAACNTTPRPTQATDQHGASTSHPGMLQAQSLNSITPVVANEEYTFRNQCGGNVMDVANHSTADQANVQVYSMFTNPPGTNQRWVVIPTSDGYYKIISRGSGKALDAAGGGTTDGTNVQQYTYAGNLQQQWKFEDDGNGYFKISPRHAPSQYLDVFNASTASGANVETYHYTGSCAQHWKLETYASLAPYETARKIISSGGIYTGNWRSTDPNIPAVTITTDAPVTLQNCLISGKGNLIDATTGHPNVTIQNCRGYAENPNDSAHFPARFFTGLSIGSLNVQNSYMAGTSGIYINQMYGSAGTVTLKNNQVRNLDGRYSTGPNSYSPTNYYAVSFIQFDKVRQRAGIDISWNEIINQPYFSRVSDVISVYNSSGTSTSRMEIHDNYIQGAFQADINNGPFSGGGIMVCDGDDQQNVPADLGYVHVSYNQVVGTNNYGITIQGGVSNEVDHNKVISSGRLSDGTRIPSNNVGYVMYAANGYATKTPPMYADNHMHDNTTGWINVQANGSTIENHWSLPDGTTNGSTGGIGDFTYLHNITPAIEADEYLNWIAKAASNSKVIGAN